MNTILLEDSYMAVKKKVVKKTAKKAVKKTVKKTTSKPAKKAAKKGPPKPTKKTAKKVAKKVTKKTVKKTEKKELKKVETKKAPAKTTSSKKVITKKVVEKKIDSKKSKVTNVIESTIKPIEQNEFINLKLHKSLHDDPRLHTHEEQKVIEEVQHPPLEPITREEPKIGRNDPCPCGSGLKYKKCCGK
jgi:uncharacterized protein YchJ